MRYSLPHDLTVNEIATVKASLVEALTPAEAVELDFSAVTSVDLAGLQLICAAAKEARELGIELTATALGDRITEAARLAGFRSTSECKHTCPWCCGGQ